jgi:VIT1/CCC1 family predicted Fe2+/Mn2+ transporter
VLNLPAAGIETPGTRVLITDATVRSGYQDVRMGPISEAKREEARTHIREHALGEAARIGRLSRIREFVLGAQDGLLVPLGVVTGMAAANPGKAAILVAGLAEAVAGSIAMGGGSYLASEAEEGLYLAEIRDEGREVEQEPEREIAELALVLEEEGLDRAAAEEVAHGLAANPNVFLRTKVQKELGLAPDAGGAAAGDAVVVGATYLGAAVIPLWPYFLFPVGVALPISLGCTLLALFALGIIKGSVARQRLLRAGLQVLLIGGVSAGVGWVIGHVVTKIVG